MKREQSQRELCLNSVLLLTYLRSRTNIKAFTVFSCLNFCVNSWRETLHANIRRWGALATQASLGLSLLLSALKYLEQFADHPCSY